MEKALYLKNKKYISAKRAAEITGYSSDYIGQLYRGKKIDATLVGRSWFLCEEDLLHHKDTHLSPYAKKTKKKLTLKKTSKRGSRKNTRSIILEESKPQENNVVYNAPIATSRQETFITPRDIESKQEVVYTKEDAPLFPELKRSFDPISTKAVLVKTIEDKVSERRISATHFDKFIKISSGAIVVVALVIVASHINFANISKNASNFGSKLSSTYKPFTETVSQNLPEIKTESKIQIENSDLIASASNTSVWGSVSLWAKNVADKMVAPWLIKSGNTVIVQKTESGLPRVSLASQTNNIAYYKSTYVAGSDRSYVDMKIEELKQYFLTNPLAPNVNRFYITRQNDVIVDRIARTTGNSTTNTTVAVSAFSDLTDTNLTNLNYGDLAMYDGSKWINTATSTLGLPSLADVDGYIHASSTIAKTYTSNTFTALQTFSFSSTTYASFNTASTTNLTLGGNTFSSLLGTGLTNVGGVLTASGLGSYDAWTHPTYGGSATTSLLTLSNGFISQASSTQIGQFNVMGNLGVGTTSPIYPLEVRNTNPSGPAIFAFSSDTSGASATYGVYARVSNTATASHAVRGQVTGNGYVTGVYGDSTNSGGYGIGVVGTSQSALGNGVYGASLTSSTAGTPAGGWFEANSSTGYGVYARNNTSSGNSIGLYASTASANGYGIYSASGRNYFAGNVGIGTTGPLGKLEVGSSQALILDNQNDNNKPFVGFGSYWDGSKVRAQGASVYGMGLLVNRGFPAASTTMDVVLSQSAGNSSLVSIQGTGNVGIGTTGPVEKLQVQGNVLASGATYPMFIASSTAGGVIQSFLSGYSNGTTERAFWDINRRTIDGVFGDATKAHAGIYLDSLASNSRIVFRTTTSNNALGGDNVIISGNGQMTIAGNVGIGTTSPYAKLSVVGDAAITGNVRLAGLTATGTVQLTNYTSGALATDATGALYTFSTSTWTFASSTLLTDSNTFSGVNRFNFSSTTYASFTTASTTNLIIGGNTFTSLLGTGLSNVGGVLTASGMGSYDAWTHPTYGGSATTSLLTFGNGFISQASSTQIGDFRVVGGNMGIGSTTPWGLLSVNANGLSSGVPQFVVGSSTATNFIVSNNGNVGIGTAVPNAKLVISNQTSGTGQLRLENSNSSTNYWDIGRDSNSTGALIFTSSLAGAAAEKVRIQTDGNVGIGTTSPYAKLSVVGDAAITGNVRLAGLTATGTVQLTNYTSGALATDATGALYTFSTSTWTFASSTLLSDSNTFSGTNVFSGALRLSNVALNSLLSTDSSGNVVATSVPTFGTFNATSTTGTSTISGGLSVAGSTGLNVLQNGKVGIGTSGPEKSLQVQVNASGQNTLLLLKNTIGIANETADIDFSLTSSQNWTNARIGAIRTNRLYSLDTDLTFSTMSNGALAERVRIQDSGNVGIGTTSPYRTLSVGGSAVFTGGDVLASTFTATSSISTPSLTLSSVAINSLLSTDSSGNVVATSVPTFGTFNATSTTGTSTIAGGLAIQTNKFVVDRSTGNVGVGTAAPTGMLHIYGTQATAYIDYSSTNGFLGFKHAGTDKGLLGLSGGANNLSAGSVQDDLVLRSSSGNILFSTNAGASTQMYIANAGNVGIGSTTPWGLLSVNANGLSAGVPQFVVGSSTATNFIVANNGNVGIGTTSPNAKLYIARAASGGSAWSGSTLVLENSGDQGLQFLNPSGTGAQDILFGDSVTNTQAGIQYDHATDKMNFLMNNWQTKLTLQNDGNFGIGTTTPYRALSVGGSAVFTGGDVLASTFTATSSISTPSLTLSSVAINSLLSTNASGVVTATSAPTFGYFNATSTAATSTIAGGLAIAGTGFVYDYSTNNVGIGTASPGRLLDVNGTSRFADTIYLGDGNGSQGQITWNSGLILKAGTSNPLHFRTNNSATDSMYISTDGNVGIGSTTPWGLLSVNANALTAGTPQFVVGSSTATNFIVANNGYVGVGMTNPTKTLDVSGSVRASGNSNSIGQGGFMLGDVTNGDYINLRRTTTGNNFALDMYNGSWINALTVLNSTGNVGIGTTSPYRTLSVGGSGVFTGGDVLASTFTATSSISTPSLTLSSVAINSLLSTNSSGVVVATSAPTFGYFNATSTTATSTIAGGLAIEGSGFVYDYSTNNVGIGTASPSQLLSLSNGNIFLTTPGKSIKFAGVEGNIYTDVMGDSSGLWFRTNVGSSDVNNNRMFIDRITGNVGIGTTTPAFKLDVYGAAGVASSIRTHAASTGGVLIGYGGYDIQGRTSADQNGNLALNPYGGNVGIASTSPWGLLSVNANGLSAGVPQFVVGSSTKTNFIIDNGGRIGIATTTTSNASWTIQGASGLDIMRIASSTGAPVITISEWGGFVQKVSSSTALSIQMASGTPVFEVDTTQSNTNAGLDITAATGQTANLLNFYSSAGTFLSGYTAAGGLFMNVSSTTAINVYNGAGTPAFVVNSASQSVGIGTSTLTYNLNVSGSQTTSYIARINNADTANTADGLLISLGVANASRGTGNYFIGFADGTQTVAGKIQGGASAVAYTTTAADIAEFFRVSDVSDMPVSGEIVMLDTNKERTVARAEATSLLDNEPLGIVSTNPGFIGNAPICLVGDDRCDTEYQKYNVLVALAGQVPLKVTDENGAVRPGDYLTLSSTTPGAAMKMTDGGYVVGIALTNASTTVVMTTGTTTSTTTQKFVIANVKSGWREPANTLVASSTDMTVPARFASLFSFFKKIGLEIGQNFIKIANLVTDSLVATKVETKELCIEGVCVNKDQLQALILQSNVQVNSGGAGSLPNGTTTATSTSDVSGGTPGSDGQGTSSSDGQATSTPAVGGDTSTSTPVTSDTSSSTPVTSDTTNTSTDTTNVTDTSSTTPVSTTDTSGPTS